MAARAAKRRLHHGTRCRPNLIVRATRTRRRAAAALGKPAQIRRVIIVARSLPTTVGRVYGSFKSDDTRLEPRPRAAPNDGCLRAALRTWVTLSNGGESYRGSGAAASYGGEVRVNKTAGRKLRAGDVVPLDDPQAHRVERIVLVDGRVVLELRPAGLDMLDTVRVTLRADRLVRRLGTAAD